MTVEIRTKEIIKIQFVCKIIIITITTIINDDCNNNYFSKQYNFVLKISSLDIVINLLCIHLIYQLNYQHIFRNCSVFLMGRYIDVCVHTHTHTYIYIWISFCLCIFICDHGVVFTIKENEHGNLNSNPGQSHLHFT